MLRVQGLRRSRVSVVLGFTVIARRNDEATNGFRGFMSLKGFNATRSRPSAFKGFSCFKFHCHGEEERQSNKWFQGFQMVSKGSKCSKSSKGSRGFKSFKGFKTFEVFQGFEMFQRFSSVTLHFSLFTFNSAPSTQH